MVNKSWVTCFHGSIDTECIDCARARPVALTSNETDDTWENNAQYLLERCPHTIRVREGGGPENLMHSFIHTFMAMEEKLRGSHETGERRPLTGLRQGQIDFIHGVTTNAALSGMHKDQFMHAVSLAWDARVNAQKAGEPR